MNFSKEWEAFTQTLVARAVGNYRSSEEYTYYRHRFILAAGFAAPLLRIVKQKLFTAKDCGTASLYLKYLAHSPYKKGEDYFLPFIFFSILLNPSRSTTHSAIAVRYSLPDCSSCGGHKT